QPFHTARLAVLALAILAWLRDCKDSKTPAPRKAEPPPIPPSAKETVVVQKPRLILLEAREPRRKIKDMWYRVHTHLDAYETLGFPTTGGKKERLFRPNGFIADDETTRHYRLADGRHAVAMYHDQHY